MRMGLALAGPATVAALALLVGAPPADARTRAEATFADAAARIDLAEARARWRAARVRDYSFRIRGTSLRRAVRIVVRDGRPRRAPWHVRDIATVPRLFATIERALDRGATVSVRYGARGVPVSIAITERAGGARRYRLTAFRS